MVSFLHSYFMFANATVSFNQIASSYPGPLSLVSILVSLARCNVSFPRRWLNMLV